LRLKTGESNTLEKTTAETQRGNIQLQLKALQQQLAVSKLQFQLLLNTIQDVEPATDTLSASIVFIADSAALLHHPLLQMYWQQQKIASANTSLERAKLLPDLNVGYFNQTFRGTGADEKVYSTSTRFNSFQVGIGIPIFAGAQKARAKASKINESIAANNYTIQLQNMQTQYRDVLLQYNNNLEAVNYYKNTALRNADTILQTANLQFLNGEINYLDWVVLTNEAIAIQSNYLNAVQALNESIISINYYVSNQQ